MQLYMLSSFKYKLILKATKKKLRHSTLAFAKDAVHAIVFTHANTYL
jgi:hypothetical protein